MTFATASGHRLVLPALSLARIASDIPHTGLQNLVRRHYRGDLRSAVGQSIAYLAGMAWPTGTERFAGSSANFPIFTSRTAEGEYQLITRPVTPGRMAILAIRPARDPIVSEVKTYQGKRAGYGSLKDLAGKIQEKGIYQIYRFGKLVYVGQSQNIGRRLQQHLWCLEHLGVSPAEHSVRYQLMPDSDLAKRRKLEKTLIERNMGKSYAISTPAGTIAMKFGNVRRELERELWGEAWG